MMILGYVFTLVMGVSLGMLGGGGSILTVPILIYLFGVNAVHATAYSLFIVGLSSAFGGAKKMQEGDVVLPIAVTFAIPGFIGVFLSRAFVIPWLPDTILSTASFTLSKDALIMLVFAVMMILASVSMIRGRKSDDAAKKEVKKNYALIALEGLGVGLLTGFVGAGGGFLIIPALVVLAGLPMKKAVGTSLVIIAAKSLLGFIGDVLRTPGIDWSLLIVLSVISIVGIFLGSHLVKYVPENRLKKAFGVFVLLMGTFILGQQIYG